MKIIDCDTPYWPVNFLDRVNHVDKGYIEREDNDQVAFYRGGKLIHRFPTSRWELDKIDRDKIFGHNAADLFSLPDAA